MSSKKLWVVGPNGAEHAVRMAMKDVVEDVNRQIVSRGVRVQNALRNAELETLSGQRSGKRYKKPKTKKAYYTASAPGEVPARRFGGLRLHWTGEVKKISDTKIIAAIESNEKYSLYLEEGTSKMAPRPYVEKIKEKAKPEIERIMSEPYN